MFFTSTSEISFTGILNVMRAYPDWTLLYIDGEQANFAIPAKTDTDYKQYWDRVQQNREEFEVSSMAKGLDQIAINNKVLFVDDGQLKGFHHSNPNHRQKVEVFATVRKSYGNILLTHNSPIQPVIKLASDRLRDRGIQEQLRLKWMGGDSKWDSKVDKMVLTPGQVVLAMVVLSLANLLCFIIFCVELLWHHISQKFF